MQFLQFCFVLNREYCDQTGITRVFGEYRARCLHSKVWALREAAISKVMMLLESEYSGDANAYLAPVCGILRLGAEDKIQQVLFNSLNLMEQFVRILKKYVPSLFYYKGDKHI